MRAAQLPTTCGCTVHRNMLTHMHAGTQQYAYDAGGWCCLTVVAVSSACGYISQHGLLTCVYTNTHACNNECVAIGHGLH